MERYKCVKCGTEWFTASLREGTRCGHCQGELEAQSVLFNLQIDDCSTPLNEYDKVNTEK